jgi:tetratricopeptide (TPR) repeat protein
VKFDVVAGAHVPHFRLLEIIYLVPASPQSDSERSLPKPSDSTDPIMEEFLAKKANELGFSVEELKSAIKEWANSVQDPYQKGLAALYDRRYAEASQNISESLNTLKGNILIHYVPLASAEYWQGHFKAAESALRKVLTAYPDDPIVLNNLALVLDDQAHYGEAELLFKRALAVTKNSLGMEHLYVAQTLNNLGDLYRHQGLPESESFYKAALAIEEKELRARPVGAGKDASWLGPARFLPKQTC